ncbi:MAG: hypothetical protein R3C69_06830 [Geminicoccaceae bacterium]
MPNHLHSILVPPTNEGMTKAIADTHRRFCFTINRRFQLARQFPGAGRFGSCAMDELHTPSALDKRSVTRGAGAAGRPAGDWRWPSADAHLGIAEDGLSRLAASTIWSPTGAGFLDDERSSGQLEVLREHVRTGRPLGTPDFVADVERRLGRALAPASSGRKRIAKDTTNG